jgi:hypothetical protein
MWLKVLKAIDDNPAWLSEEISVIVQIDPSEETEVSLNRLETVDQRRYGKTLLWFFVVPEGQSDGDTPQEKST